ncbi:MAG: ThuA domain-containing protein [Nitrososphaerota archaeon]|nr:ThuA domain-containing protein [Candidatus Bathyarchaeota archaeon]MDW8061078.1 ThuA domain-containing protein [Nitrososphaerota archaeon]
MKPLVLVFTHSAGFRHSYLSTAVEVLTKLGERTGLFDVYATEDCRELSEDKLKEFDCFIFLTTGEPPLQESSKKTLIELVRSGRGFVGVHNATDTFYNFREYGEMLGGYFHSHPWTQEVYVIVEDSSHPSTRHLPSRFKVLEEVYTFKDWDPNRTHTLIRLDNSSVDLSKGTRSDNYYALTWCHSYGSGRVFYTGFGHFTKIWREEWFQRHLLGGILWSIHLEDRLVS